MTDERKLRAMFGALADNVESLSDEELLAEVRESGRSPEDIAKRTRSGIRNAVKTFKQRPKKEDKSMAEAKSIQRREAAVALLGKRVRFRGDLAPIDSYLVLQASDDGMVQIEGHVGKFAPHLFEVEERGGDASRVGACP